MKKVWITLALLALAACRGPKEPPHAATPALPVISLPPPSVYTPTLSFTTQVSPTAAPSAATDSPAPVTPGATATVTISPPPDPYAAWTIDSLATRSYGGGEITVHETLAETGRFTRYLISYPSDGLQIYGFMNVPKQGEPPFPVVIALHGYIEPEVYATLDYTTGYADALARAGFLVLHPNLRGYPPSDTGDNLFRVGMAVDVLNLAALVREWGGREGSLLSADPQAIGLWGHSMGGGIATRVITVDPEIRAAVLYGAMSGDDQKNFERVFDVFSNGQRGSEELSTPGEAFLRISPMYIFDRIQAAVSIHHGDNDSEVPLSWSEETCAQLQALGKVVECYTYEDQPHTFYGEGNDLFIERTIDFLRRYNKPPT